MSVQASIVINRPVEEVFHLLTGGDDNPFLDWPTILSPEGLYLHGPTYMDASSEITITKISDGPARVGATYRRMVRVRGEDEQETIEVTEYVPNSRYSYKISADTFKGHFVYAYLIESSEAGTKVTLKVDNKLQGPLRWLRTALALPLATFNAELLVDGPLYRLKLEVESSE